MTHSQKYTITIKIIPVVVSTRNRITVSVRNQTTGLYTLGCTVKMTAGDAVYTLTKDSDELVYYYSYALSALSTSSVIVTVADSDGTMYTAAALNAKSTVQVTKTTSNQQFLIYDELTINDYDYLLYDDGTASAKVTSDSKSKSTLSGLFSSVYSTSTARFYKLTDLTSCFNGCISLTAPPVIPFGVQDMTRCFYGCTQLAYPPKLPASVVSLDYCFYNCNHMATSQDFFIIPENAKTMDYMFHYCDYDGWISKVLILSQSVTSANYMFDFINATQQDARGILNNVPSSTNYSLRNDKLEYGSEALASSSTSYSGATINTWPVRTSPTSGTKLGLDLLLTKLLTQIVAINSLMSSIQTFVNTVAEGYLYHGGRTTNRTNFTTWYAQTSTPQHKVHKIDSVLDDGSTYNSDYIIYYRHWTDGFSKVIFYHGIGNYTATQKCDVTSSKYVYNRASEATVTSAWSGSTNIYLGGLWKNGYVQPLRRGNPICATGSLVQTGDTATIGGATLGCTFQMYATSNSAFANAHLLCMGLLGSDSIDNFYE